MSRSSIIVSSAALLLLAACGDQTTQAGFRTALGSAFNSTPAGFDVVQSSFAATTDGDGTGGPGAPWMPDGRADRGGHGGPGMGDFMGGGFGPGFLGDIGVGHGFDHGPFGGTALDASCVFSATTGDVTCAAVTRDGITVNRVATYKTTAGVAQAKPDSTTNSVRMRITAAGTRTRRDSATSVLSHSSDRTVTGLAVGSTSRTVNGVSAGSESTTGKTATGAFTSVRIAGDTTKALVIPVEDGKPTYPKSGSVVRYSKVTSTVAGGTPSVSNRKETITYNGTATATIVIVQDGVSKTCTVALPHGRPSCS